MSILVTGASGLLGSELTRSLRASGEQVVPLRRGGRDLPAGEASWDPAAGRIDLRPAGTVEAVFHLAGEAIGRRWTAGVKRRMWDSRCRGTQLLSEALAGLTPPPRTLVCASATGYYGNRGDAWLNEESGPGQGYLADLVQAWEAAAAPAEERGIRVVHLRFGIVLARAGGALAKMLPAFRCGLGGRLGDGRQFWSWIELGDAVRCLRHARACESLRGAVNATSPLPVANGEFAATLARVLRRPCLLPMPRWAVALAFGEMGREAMLASCRVEPVRLKESGFEWEHPRLEEALRSCLGAKNL